MSGGADLLNLGLTMDGWYDDFVKPRSDEWIAAANEWPSPTETPPD